jgi:glycine oxidase
MRVTIIGAGVAGLTAALTLFERAAGQPISITILEKSQILGAESCSRYAGGMLAPWCERENAEEPVLVLGQEALVFWPRWVDTVQCGTLVVAPMRDEAELDRFGRRTSGFSTIDAHQLADFEPDLNKNFRRGLFFADEAHLNPRLALQSLAGHLRDRGVDFQFGVIADPDQVVGEWVIDCRGLAARQQLPDLRPVKGEMLLIHCPDVALTRPVRLLHPRIPIYIVPRGDGVYMLGATMIESDDRGRISARSMVEMLNAAYAINPAFAEAEIIEIGSDARPAFSNNLPRVTRTGRIITINGLYRHGFLLSPAMARQAADLVFNASGAGHEDHSEWQSA